jgi:hypothetical protein
VASKGDCLQPKHRSAHRRVGPQQQVTHIASGFLIPFQEFVVFDQSDSAETFIGRACDIGVAGRTNLSPMVRISVTPAAFDAIAATLALGSVGFEAAPAGSGERQIWIDARVADRLAAMRGPGESYSDVILRLVELEGRGRP